MMIKIYGLLLKLKIHVVARCLKAMREGQGHGISQGGASREGDGASVRNYGNESNRGILEYCKAVPSFADSVVSFPVDEKFTGLHGSKNLR